VTRDPRFLARAQEVYGDKTSEILQGIETTLARSPHTFGVLARDISGVAIYTLVTEETPFCPATVIYYTTGDSAVMLLDVIRAQPDDPGL